MYAAGKEELFAAIKSHGIRFDALFAVLYDELAEAERNNFEIIIYKDDSDEVNFFALTDDMRVSAYIKTEENLNFFHQFLRKYENITVTDYYNVKNLESQNIYTAFCRFNGGFINSTPSSARLMTIGDEELSRSFQDDPDDYLEQIFSYTVKEPLYETCGIYAVFAQDAFAGYLSFYSIEKYLDVSYVYVAEKWRRRGFASTLMSAFLGYCSENGFIPYYSSADGEESTRLVEKFGFEKLGERIEYTYRSSDYE